MFIIKNLSINFGNRVLIDDFSISVSDSDHIAIMGRNGSGKSTLLKHIHNQYQYPYIPQIINRDGSDGEKFMQSLNEIMQNDPSVLLLDEPSNHLDEHNRKILIKILRRYNGILLCVTHDVEILELFSLFWHLDNGTVHVFSGQYNDYIDDLKLQKRKLEKELAIIDLQKDKADHKFIKEKERAAKSAKQGKKAYANNKLEKMTRDHHKNSAQKFSGKQQMKINKEKEQILDRLSNLNIPEVITPKFWIKGDTHATSIVIKNGTVSRNDRLILHSINLSIGSGDRMAIVGPNGSGKSTLLKAMLDDPNIIKTGEWKIPINSIGYLDQDYNNLDESVQVFDTINDIMHDPDLTRKHLNNFLFRNNDEVEKYVKDLSGGERARLSLCKIAAQGPKIMLLDEISNNIDLETKEHVIEVLNAYEGVLVVISHDKGFVNRIKINRSINSEQY